MSKITLNKALPPSRIMLEELIEEPNILTRLYKTGVALLGLDEGIVTSVDEGGINHKQRTIPLPFEPGMSIFMRAAGIGSTSFFPEPYTIDCGTIDQAGDEVSIRLERGLMKYVKPAEPFDSDLTLRFDKYAQLVLAQKIDKP